MRITVIGTGYVGLVTGACLAELGNDVICLDLDAEKIAVLNDGGLPIHEPDLKEIIERNCAAGRLVFSTNVEESVTHGEVQFIAVGTPADEDGSADLKYVLAAARNIGRTMVGRKVIVDKSTVPVGTAEKVRATIVAELIARGLDPDAKRRQLLGQPAFSVVSNPEFLKEGAAVKDFMQPDRIVLGIDGDELGAYAHEIMRKLYEPFNKSHDRILAMDVKSAEFTKYAANAMLATRISFMNELANLADELGADIEMVRQGIGSDSRIGNSFLYAGIGYGGSCFPKDVKALSHTAKEYGQNLRVLAAVEAVNTAQKRILVDKIVNRFGPDLTGHIFAIWGLAFKPNTDDMREAPSRVIIRELLSLGASLRVYDPIAMGEARRCLAHDLSDQPKLFARIYYAESELDAVASADALLIVTEWKEFQSPDFAAIKSSLKRLVIFDGRNLFNPKHMHQLSFEYNSIGRASEKRIASNK